MNVVALAVSETNSPFEVCGNGPASLDRQKPQLRETIPVEARGVPGGVPDLVLRRDVERRLRADRAVSIAETADSADIVLIVQARYIRWYRCEAIGRLSYPPPPPRRMPLPTWWPDDSRPSIPEPDIPPIRPAEKGVVSTFMWQVPDGVPNARMSLVGLAVKRDAFPCVQFRRGRSNG